MSYYCISCITIMLTFLLILKEFINIFLCFLIKFNLKCMHTKVVMLYVIDMCHLDHNLIKEFNQTITISKNKICNKYNQEQDVLMYTTTYNNTTNNDINH